MNFRHSHAHNHEHLKKNLCSFSLLFPLSPHKMAKVAEGVFRFMVLLAKNDSLALGLDV